MSVELNKPFKASDGNYYKLVTINRVACSSNYVKCAFSDTKLCAAYHCNYYLDSNGNIICKKELMYIRASNTDIVKYHVKYRIKQLISKHNPFKRSI